MSWDAYKQLVEKVIHACPALTGIRLIKDVSGHSGADTFLVQPFWSNGALSPAIIKVGPTAIVNNDAAGLDIAIFQYGVDAVIADVTEGNFRILLLKLMGGASCTTFEAFYLDSATTPSQVENTVTSLFKEVMQVQSLNLQKDRNPFVMYQFRDAIDQSRALREIGDGLPTMIRWWERAGNLSHQELAHGAMCHGDLHRKNILVDGSRVCIIDFGLLRRGHAFRDFAKLERDVLLFLYPQECGYSVRLHPTSNDFIPVEDTIGNVALDKSMAAIRAIRNAAQQFMRGDCLFEYFLALMAQMVFAASDNRQSHPVRILALDYAQSIRGLLETHRPKLAIPDVDRSSACREDALWQFSYAFLRLDQLRSGGWGRSLPCWFEALVEGDAGTIGRNPEMRTKGGTDLTVYGFMGYLNFLARCGYTPARPDRPASFNKVADLFWNNMRERIGYGGGVGTGHHGRASTPVNIRHTAIGLLGFLTYARWTGRIPTEAIRQTSDYLFMNLRHSDADTTHLFGGYCALSKLMELLPLETTGQDLKPLLDEIAGAQLRIAGRLNEPQPYALRPEGTCRLTSADFPFRPYSDFWRMERSNLVMYVPLLLTEDRDQFHDFVDPRVLSRCTEALGAIAGELDNGTPAGLCFYHRDGDEDPQRHDVDWALSAEVLALMEMPAIKEHLPNADGIRKRLRDSLVNTFDQYHPQPNLFRFTHACALSRFLMSVDCELPNHSTLKKLDRHIDQVITAGITEHNLHELCNHIIESSVAGYAHNDKRNGQHMTSPLRDLLLDKLQPGEHVISDGQWARTVAEAQISTVTFFDGKGGREYADYYCRSENIIRSFVTEIPNKIKLATTGAKRAIDVGCGPGQYAEVLAELGFSVELYDASLQMLQLAHRRLKKVELPVPRDLGNLAEHFDANYFDLIFACAIMVHVPRDQAHKVYRSFHKILSPGGGLFVNYKIGDHSLVGIGKRYFEYYRDDREPWKMLEEAGFEIHELSLRWNRTTMYRDPKQIHWANFYCTKK